MRYRKSIRIGKGLRINLSKSGLSLSTGIKGLSLTTGRKGTYLNAGIPGTGIYDRKRIDAGGNHSAVRTTSQLSGTFDIHMDSDGTVTFSQDGVPITNPPLIRTIKRSAEYKAEKLRLTEKWKKEIKDKVEVINSGTDSLINVASLSQAVLSASEVQDDLNKIKPEKYKRREFSESKPLKEENQHDLEAEAKRTIHSIAFWSLDKKRKKYVKERLQIQYQKDLSNWEKKKQAFDAIEQEKEKKINEKYLEDYNTKTEYLRAVLEGKKEFVEQQVDSCLKKIELPLDFSVQYDYVQQSHFLYVDLDLPEIEDLPDDKAAQLASGKLKMKKKSKTENRADYARCVFGFAVFFASHLFNISTAIDKICISGFTQRRDKDGNLFDDYIYSIIFNRSKFEGQNIKTLNPIDFCMTFENRCILSKTNVFKTIKPFESE